MDSFISVPPMGSGRMENSMEQITLYLKLEKNVEIATDDVFLKDLGSLYCKNDNVVNKCRSAKICRLTGGKDTRKVISVMKIIQKLDEMYPGIEVQNIGESDVVVERITRENVPKWKEWLKIAFVSLITFFGTSFTIMAFHNDIGITDLFNGIHKMITGVESGGLSTLEFSYSIGLCVGIIVFFNHIGGRRITKDPTPIEVEMRIYEDEVNQTLIDYADRMQLEMDVKKG